MTEAKGESRSTSRLRWVGYGLLLFALIDSLLLFIPPSFLNPVWELQTMGGLVERSAIPLMGMALIFIGEYNERLGLEELFLKLVSWFSLVLALLFLLMIPLGIVNTVRINSQNNQQINSQIEQQLAQINQIESQVNQSKLEALQPLIAQLQKSGAKVDPNNENDIKTSLRTVLNQGRSEVLTQSETVRNNRQLQLLKTSVKLNLGALIAATLFFVIWKSTGWAR